jgi:hypothetical protein
LSLLFLLLFSLIQPLVYPTKLLAILVSLMFACQSVHSPICPRRLSLYLLYSLIEVFSSDCLRRLLVDVFGRPPISGVRLSQPSLAHPSPAFACQSVRSPARLQRSLVEAFRSLSASSVRSLKCSLAHPSPAFACRSVRSSACLRRSPV